MIAQDGPDLSSLLSEDSHLPDMALNYFDKRNMVQTCMCSVDPGGRNDQYLRTTRAVEHLYFVRVKAVTTVSIINR